MNQAQAAFFDSQAEAPWADAPYGESEASKLKRLLSLCGPLKGKAVLEPGCGTGRLTQWLAQVVGPGGCVQACDISGRMVRKAQERTCGLVQVRIYHAAMEDLDLAGGSLDLVLCHQVFPHFKDQSAALAYIAKVLKPGGTLVIAHFECRRHINDVHRKAGTVVEHDQLPERQEIEVMLNAVGLRIRHYFDDPKLGYLLIAR
jgi:ubiquinone/menaquinone biosynthesis C-methylase UbiE